MTQALRIAVADDERDMRQFFQEVLTHLGHKVIVNAETGRQLIERCRAAVPDLIITDIKMPDMDGIEAAIAVNRDKETPVVLVSGHTNPEFLRRVEQHPIMAYLIKPLKAADVDVISGQTSRRGLHRPGETTEECFLVVLVDESISELLLLQMSMNVPVLHEHARGVVVQLPPFARELLMLPDDSHDRQEHRVSGELPDGLRRAERLLNAFHS